MKSTRAAYEEHLKRKLEVTQQDKKMQRKN